MRETLFRKEAVDNKTNSFVSGTPMVSPLSFSIFSLFVSLLATAVIALLFLGRYSPKDTVRGYITTTKGGVEVYGHSDGTILELLVAEGDSVTKDQDILSLSTSRAVGQSAVTRKRVIATLRSEQTDLMQQAQRERDAFKLQEQGVAEEIASLRIRLKLLSEQRAGLETGLQLSEQALLRLTSLDASEFSSRKEQDEARSAIVEFQLRLGDLGLTEDAVRSDMRRMQLKQIEMPVLSDGRDAEMRVRNHQLSAKITESMGRDTQRVLAPSTGIISGLLVREGQTISANSPLFSIVPENIEFFVEILIPTQTIGFIRSGATVRIRYDAYPHQKFGTYDGVIESVSRTTVLPSDKRFRVSVTEPMYIARVRISSQRVRAYGEAQALQSGMTLSADVLRDERRLIQWIFDPLVSASQRL